VGAATRPRPPAAAPPPPPQDKRCGGLRLAHRPLCRSGAGGRWRNRQGRCDTDWRTDLRTRRRAGCSPRQPRRPGRTRTAGPERFSDLDRSGRAGHAGGSLTPTPASTRGAPATGLLALRARRPRPL